MEYISQIHLYFKALSPKQFSNKFLMRLLKDNERMKGNHICLFVCPLNDRQSVHA